MSDYRWYSLCGWGSSVLWQRLIENWPAFAIAVIIIMPHRVHESVWCVCLLCPSPRKTRLNGSRFSLEWRQWNPGKIVNWKFWFSARIWCGFCQITTAGCYAVVTFWQRTLFDCDTLHVTATDWIRRNILLSIYRLVKKNSVNVGSYPDPDATKDSKIWHGDQCIAAACLTI